MYKDNRILVVIPARGGSKGIPRKNIRLLGGKPLIAHTIEMGKASKYVDDIIVTTDDNEINSLQRNLVQKLLKEMESLQKTQFHLIL